MSVDLKDRQMTTAELSAEVVTALQEAMTGTYASICGANPEPIDNVEGSEEQVVALISLAGEPPLSLMIMLPRETAVKVSEKFAGFEFEFDSEDMNDLVGELSNIMAGDAKSRLLALGIETTLSLPTVIRGKDVRFNFNEQAEVYKSTYRSEEGHFSFQVVVANPEQLKTKMQGS